MAEIDNVPIGAIRINGSTQSRVELSQVTIAEYTEAIRQGAELPPVVMFFDGADFWLADGFHRFHAHREAGAMEIAAEIRTGTQRDAVLYSVGANASHGLRRSNEDKRKAVVTLLSDPEWATWSNNAIAKACVVSDKTVAAYRAEYLRNSEDSEPRNTARTVERNGKSYQMDTEKIGPAPAPVVTASAEPPSPSTASSAESQPSVATPRDATPAPGPVEITALSSAADSSPSATPPNLVQQVMDQQAAAEADAVGDTAPAAPKMIEVEEEAYLEMVRNLEQTIADNAEMGRVFDADDKLRAAMEEIKRHKASAESAKQSLDSKMGENNELIRTVKSLRRQLDSEKKRADQAEQQLARVRAAA